MAVALVLVLAFAISVPGFAADFELSSETTQGVPVTFGVAQSFLVTIPEAVALDANGEGSGTVSVSDAILPFGESLTVTITGATNYDAGFRLKDGDNDSFIGYAIKKGENLIQKDIAFLTVAAGDSTGSIQLDFAASAATIAGQYSDNLTFTVAVA